MDLREYKQGKATIDHNALGVQTEPTVGHDERV